MINMYIKFKLPGGNEENEFNLFELYKQWKIQTGKNYSN